MKLSDLQAELDARQKTKKDMHSQLMDAQRKRIQTKDWLDSITAATPIDEITKAEGEYTALARVIQTLDAAVNTADELYRVAERNRDYWVGRAAAYVADIENAKRKVRRAEQNIVEALHRVETMKRSKEYALSELADLEAKHREIVGDTITE